MKMAARIILLAAAVALGWWLWIVFFPGAEKVILKKMSGLAATASFSANANSVSRAGKALDFIGYFSTDAQIIMDVPGLGAHTFSGRDEIREAGNGGLATLPGLKVSFLDTTVRVGPDRLAAEVSCTLRVTVGNDKDYGVQEMHFQFKKIDGAWLITRVETVKTLT